MGFYNSKFYYFKDLQHHQCNECTYNDEQTYVQSKSLNDYAPMYITALHNENRDVHKYYEQCSYKLQSCPKIQERGEYDSKTYILLKPWRFCSLASNMIGKIFETKTSQKLVQGSINTISELANKHGWDGYSLEHSFAPAINMKDLSFMKDILLESVNKTDVVFIDSDYLHPSKNWKRVYNMQLNSDCCFKVNDKGEITHDKQPFTSDKITSYFHLMAENI
jgi:hypothetical protein